MTTPLHQMSRRDLALRYIKLGLAVIPVPFKDKAPVVKGWQKLRITADQVDHHFNGRPQNIGALMGDPSGGVVDVDLDCAEALHLARSILPATPARFGRTGKPNSHWLYLCIDPPEKTKRYQDTREDANGKSVTLIELRSTGGQTVFPGSVHASGEFVEFVNDCDLDNFSPAPADGMYLAALVAKVAAGALIARHWPGEGARHDAAMALAGGLLLAGWAQEDVETFIRSIVEAAHDPELDDRVKVVAYTASNVRSDQKTTGFPSLAKLIGKDVVSAVREWLGLKIDISLIGSGLNDAEPPSGNTEKPKPSGESDIKRFPLTEYGNAQRLVDRHGDVMRWNAARGEWMSHDKIVWKSDEHGAVVSFAKQVARSFWKEAKATKDGALKKMIVQHATRSEKSTGIDAMLKLARSEPGITVTADQLDSNPWHFNTLAGTIDLLAPGKLLPHDPAHLITKIAPVVFDPNARCPLWEKTLARIFNNNAELIGYVARVLGMCMTGTITEQEIYFLFGTGANGKNVCIDTYTGIMGDYAAPAPDGLLTVRAYDEHPCEIADLLGMRAVVASELEEGAQLKTALMKRLTGDSVLKGRFMRENFFSFTRTHKTFIVTNNKPVIRESTHAVWRRVRLVPFEVTIPENERDTYLTEKLKAEWPGILNWLIRGCLDWQTGGMRPPDKVLLASAEYQKEQDALAEFLADCCEIGKGRVGRNTLFQMYQSWAQQTREPKPLARAGLFERVRRISGVKEDQWRPFGVTVPIRGFLTICLKNGGES